MKYYILDLGIMVAIISFLGFVVENVWLAITKGYMNNRNMNAPFLLGYGLVVLFLYFVLGTPANPVKWGLLRKTYSKKIQYIVYFLCSFVVVCIGEIILGTIVEWLCGFEYWNYSNIPMHITKYTSIPTSTGFATMITFFMGECFTPLMNWITRLHSIWLRGISVGLMVIMISDFLISFYHMIVEKDFYLKWKIVVRDNREMTKI